MSENSSGKYEGLREPFFRLDDGAPLEFGSVADVPNNLEGIACELEERTQEGSKPSFKHAERKSGGD